MRRAIVRGAAAAAAASGAPARRACPPILLRSPSSATAATATAPAGGLLPGHQHHQHQHQQRRLASSGPAGGRKDGPGGQVMNEAIRTERVRLVVKDEATGKSTTEVVSRDAALAKAKQLRLDLVLVSKASEPWVCKLMDARKEEYLRQKKERQRSKASKQAQAIKELGIRGNISDHDLLIKLRRVTDFFAQGHTVRLILLPTSSQMSRRPLRLQELRDFILNDFLANKTKSVVEIKQSSPTSLRREIILHPKRHPSSQQQQQQQQGASGGSGGGDNKAKEAPSGGGGGARAASS